MSQRPLQTLVRLGREHPQIPSAVFILNLQPIPGAGEEQWRQGAATEFGRRMVSLEGAAQGVGRIWNNIWDTLSRWE